MPASGDVLDIPELGVQVVIRNAGADSGGQELELDVLGRPRGFLAAEHVHVRQRERHEMVSGTMELVLAGRRHVLRPGEAMEVPAGTPHRQLPGPGDASGHVRVSVRPAGTTLQFLERLAEYSRAGRLTRSGFPTPLAAAELVRDFGDEGHATRPPLPVQKALARALLGAAGLVRTARRRAAGGAASYVFVDEWDVAAAPEAVFDAVADARTYPQWWTPVYLDVDADGPPALGRESRQHFKGRLPYHLRIRSRTVALERPRRIEGEVDGDLRGRGIWTLTPTSRGTHVRFDWQVYADRPLLRRLTPLLRPAFRWNHDWAIARAKAGLEPYARRAGAVEAAAREPAAAIASEDAP